MPSDEKYPQGRRTRRRYTQPQQNLSPPKRLDAAVEASRRGCSLAPLAHAGRLLTAPLRAAARLSRGLSSGGPGTLYDTLGIARDEHDAAAIKLAFRRQARVVHPDARRGSDATAFVRLVHAYETLSCPKRRALYDATLGDTNGGGWRSAAAEAAAAGDADADAETVERDDARGTGAVTHPRRELDNALARAFHGPPVDLAAVAQGVFPPCFEGDERAALPHEDLLQLCSGRTLLGVVRHIVLKAVEGGGGEHTALCVVDAAPLLHDELWLLSHTGKLVASARRSPRGPQDAGGPVSPWLSAGVGAGEGSIDIFLHDGDAAHLHCRVGAAGGGYGFGSVQDAAGIVICSVFLHSTPFVTHLHFFATNGKLRCRAVRAWLPPSSFWLFQPREASHDAGGWSFEFYDRDRDRDAHSLPALHSAVAVLVAAFHTLDKERGRRSGMLGSLRGALASIRARMHR